LGAEDVASMGMKSLWKPGSARCHSRPEFKTQLTVVTL